MRCQQTDMYGESVYKFQAISIDRQAILNDSGLKSSAV